MEDCQSSYYLDLSSCRRAVAPPRVLWSCATFEAQGPCAPHNMVHRIVSGQTRCSSCTMPTQVKRNQNNGQRRARVVDLSASKPMRPTSFYASIHLATTYRSTLTGQSTLNSSILRAPRSDTLRDTQILHVLSIGTMFAPPPDLSPLATGGSRFMCMYLVVLKLSVRWSCTTYARGWPNVRSLELGAALHFVHRVGQDEKVVVDVSHFLHGITAGPSSFTMHIVWGT
ncbi:hypothetical protein BD626DRAFT_34053 [Schizophyllum amplum]|uniref:Uncharacterized protein n=1 Tax=Schizophyllum amplum TaxID=97359 RepID=A0A550CEE2_9AGAR|nr:hypothetical protein BD626DRAFT_34053 [Auriculariopsis ampla]